VIEPAPMADVTWNYVVLGVAMVFEGISWTYGWKAFSKERRGRAILASIVGSKDPTTYSVLLEDSAALLGLVFAFAGIWASGAFDMPWLDGAASMLIGLLLCSVAILMVNESRKLLVGVGVEKSTLEGIRAIACADPHIEQVGHLFTMYLGPQEVMLVIEVRFKPGSTADVRAAVGRLTRSIQEKYSKIRRVSFDSISLTDPAPPPEE